MFDSGSRLFGWQSLRIIIGATAVTAGLSLPVILFGSVSAVLPPSQSLGAGRVGLVVAAFYFICAVVSVPCGFLADRLTGFKILRISAWLGSVLLLGAAVFGDSSVALVLLILCGAIPCAAAPPASSVYLVDSISGHRLGFAFGVKQTAVPVAVVLAGIAVPVIVLSYGWRWSFAAGALFTVGAALALPSVKAKYQVLSPASMHTAARGSIRPLLLLTVAFGFGLIAASALPIFLVASAVGAGISEGAAGLLTALAGFAGISARILVASSADRSSLRDLHVVALMLALGGLGYVLLALGSGAAMPWVFAPAAVLAFGSGYGWNALFVYAVVKNYPQSSAWATSVTQTGNRIGSVIGPLSFGLIAEHSSYEMGWLMCASAAVVAAALMRLGDRRLQTAPIEVRT